MDSYAPNVAPKPVTGEVIEANSLTVEQRLALLEKQVHALGLAQLRHMQEQHGIGPKPHPQEPTRELLQQ
jgi:hypothetical protein